MSISNFFNIFISASFIKVCVAWERILSALFVSCGKDYAAVYYQNGSADFDYSGKGVDENTVFELGSCGKTVAAYTALALVDEGKLDIFLELPPQICL